MTQHYQITTFTDEPVAAGTQPNTMIVLEGHWYFPPSVVDMQYLRVTERTYTCPYKGVCYWIDLEAPGARAQNIAWVYRDPKPGFEMIKDWIGFFARDTAGTHARSAR
jgi:uncharacterized protein (DUF427 family)